MVERDEYAILCEEATVSALAPYAHAWEGEPAAEVVCLTSLSVPVSEQVRTALSKALVALGYAEGSFLICSTSTIRPEEARLIVESVAPLAAICLDHEAAKAIADVYGFAEAGALPIPVGALIQAPMRSFVVLDDFPGSLDDVGRKRAAWHQMQTARRVTSRL